MRKPICDFVNKYAEAGNLRLHMPGHKGIRFLGVEDKDITEVDGADVLYNAHGIIAESENYASALFGSYKTLYSTEGSSLCIRAMVYLSALQAKKNGKRPLILASRNAHKAFMSALALVDADVEWIYPEEEENMISCRVSAEQVERRLAQMEELPIALYITSPDYLGVTSDIRGISKVCQKNGVLLMIDNAHGAYLKFLSESRHPLDMGADICCDSAHKTLPVLTGGAYLHISQTAPVLFSEMAEQAMSLFASTSPSYLILQSLDMANAYMADGYMARLENMSSAVNKMKKALREHGFYLFGDEEMKLCIKAKKYGYYGYEIADFLACHGVACEFYDKDLIVMMFTPEIGKQEINKLTGMLLSLPKKSEITEPAPTVGASQRVMTVREAFLSPSYEIEVEKACGYVLASANVSCPPAIPIVVCGEKIDERAIDRFKYYGIEKCRVVG